MDLLQSFEPGSAVHDLPVNWRVRYALTPCVVRPAGPSGAARLLSNRAAAMMRRSARSDYTQPLKCGLPGNTTHSQPSSANGTKRSYTCAMTSAS